MDACRHPEFEAALVELERSPLSTPDIRAGPADVVTIWRRLTAAAVAATPGDAAARTVIATDSEALQASSG